MALVAATATGTACTPGPPPPPPCTAPYAPAAHFIWSTPPPGWPVPGELATVDLGSDTDGDGVPDTVTPADGVAAEAVTVHRASGDLVLTGHTSLAAAPAYSVWSTGSPWAGDVDGDGLTDVFVRTYDAADDMTRTYVVPGSTPAGTYDPAVIGYGVPVTAMEAGDVLDGDGLDDIFVADETMGAVVIPGRVVAARTGPFDPSAPGFEAVNVPGSPALRPVVPLTDDVTAIAMGNGAVLWSRGVSATFDLSPPWSSPDGRPNNASVWHGDDGSRWYVVSNGHRNAGVGWAFNLDDLCGSSVATLLTGA